MIRHTDKAQSESHTAFEAFEGRRWGLRSRRGPSTSPIVGTYVYLPGTAYRLGIHDVPLEGLVQVRRVFRGTSAEPPPPRPTPPSGRRSLPGPSPSRRRRTAPAPSQQGDRLDHERRPSAGHLYGDAGVVFCCLGPRRPSSGGTQLPSCVVLQVRHEVRRPSSAR